MSDDNQNFHGSSGPPPSSVGEPTLAEKARTLLSLGGNSSLATMSRKHEGFPFASVMPYAIDEDGRPIFLISQMAMHTKNVRSEPRATLLVAERSDSPLGAARISVMGNVKLIEDDGEKAKAAQTYLEQHPDSQQWAGFGDFGYYRMEVVDVYFIGGFGVMGWITPDEYSSARPDPLAGFAKDIIEHMNEDHVDSMVLLAKSELGIDAEVAMMSGIDRNGFNMMVKTAEGVRGARIAFSTPVETANDTRKVLVQMVKAARGEGE